ncbi:MAG: HpcH/HpaI aldolase/citrate lyase family protein [Desulfovibrio sp.]
MKTNPLKHALLKHQQTYGCWVTLGHPLIPEILAPAGFDWLAIDMEHTSITLSDLLPLLMSTEANGMVPLVRLGENNPTLIKRVMDAGAYGIIVPNVMNAEEAQAAVRAVRYPPHGTRGVGLYRAQRFGVGFEEYKRWLMDESVVIVQIEHIDAVRDIKSILTTEGVDGFMIGPYDMSGSLGRPGDFDNPEFKKALDEVILAARELNVPAGFHSVPSDPALAGLRRDEGYTFLAYGVDAILLGEAARGGMKQLKG